MNEINLSQVKAMTFDVFGTVVDWRRSIAREIQELGQKKGFDLDWNSFADEWRSGYAPSMNKVRNGEMPWTKIDNLHRMILDELLSKHKISILSEEEIDSLNKAWHRLDPWPDSVEGLTLLKRNYIISSLSNGNVALLVNMAKYGGLPWDVVLSAEFSKHYKPDPESYLSTGEYLGIPINQVMMVAAHKNDLKSAKSNGMMTGYVPRAKEHGENTVADYAEEDYIDIMADDFIDLSQKMSATKETNS
ncbi:MAG: 2-haloacid dehalogenase [Chloroflexi bacterium]|jgi:2-haloacid dehalogenase|nr:MAG: 2-haloacid dehalogenase [Chloroflexota bacterium]